MQSGDHFLIPKVAPFGIFITTYEYDQDNDEYTPILSHIFWGQNFNQALDYAKSHLISDVFFSSSFVGELPWRDSVLILSNDGSYLGSSKAPSIKTALNQLKKKAKDVNEKQVETGMIQTVQMLSSE